MQPSHLIDAVRAYVGGVLPQQRAGDTTDLDWEEAGSLLWDVAGLGPDAVFLVEQCRLLDVLPPVLTSAASAQQWRALEVGLGMLGNLACHDAVRLQLQQQQGLPELLVEQLLWMDDAAALAELCRFLSLVAVIGDGGGSGGGGGDEASALAAAPGAVECWWELLLGDECLGRLAWMLENTLSAALLERV